MKLPKTFRLGGRKWEVRVVDRLPHWRMGEVTYDDAEVRVARNGPIKPYTPAQQKEVLLHEIIHAVLDEGWPEHNKEKFVEPFAKKLAAVINTARY